MAGLQRAAAEISEGSQTCYALSHPLLHCAAGPFGRCMALCYSV